MKFVVESGVHSQAGQEYKKGDVVDCDRNLIELFPNKFKRGPEEPVIQANLDKVPDSVVLDEAVKVTAPIPVVEKPLGKDITDSNPAAVKLGLMVFELENGDFAVTDEKDHTKPLNAAPLKSKTDLVNFLKAQSGK